MWWRTTRTAFSRDQGEGNRCTLKALVDAGNVPGLLGYVDGEPVAWCAVGPRDDFPSLNRSPVLKPIDETPVWSIVCLFIHRRFRGRGLGEAMVRRAVAYAAERGASTLEAYPTSPRGKRLAPVSSFMGTPALFERAGFVEIARPSPARVIMRLQLGFRFAGEVSSD